MSESPKLKKLRKQFIVENVMPKVTPKVIVKQAADEPEIPAEIIAKAVVEVSEAARKMNAAGLREEAIVLLLNDRCRVGKTEIRLILRMLPELRRIYTTK